MGFLEVLALILMAYNIGLNTAQEGVKRPVNGPRFGIFTDRGFYWIEKPKHLPPIPRFLPAPQKVKTVQEEVDGWFS